MALGYTQGLQSGVEGVTGTGQQIVDAFTGTMDAGTVSIQTSAEQLGNAMSIGLQNAHVDQNITNQIKTALKMMQIAITNSNASFKGSGRALAINIASGFASGNLQTQIVNTARLACAAVIQAVSSQQGATNATAKALAQSMALGFAEANAGESMASAARSAADAARSALQNAGLYDSARSVGGYFVQGFADGISANTYKAEAKAKAMAAAADRAAKNELQVRSRRRRRGGWVRCSTPVWLEASKRAPVPWKKQPVRCLNRH